MTRFGPECELEEPLDTPEQADLRRLLIRFETLMERCWEPYPMDPNAAHELNEMYGALHAIEQTYWDRVPEESVALLQSRLDEEFVMIKQTLGLLKPNLVNA
jgi:hypothetical protein